MKTTSPLRQQRFALQYALLGDGIAAARFADYRPTRPALPPPRYEQDLTFGNQCSESVRCQRDGHPKGAPLEARILRNHQKDCRLGRLDPTLACRTDARSTTSDSLSFRPEKIMHTRLFSKPLSPRGREGRCSDCLLAARFAHTEQQVGHTPSINGGDRFDPHLGPRVITGIAAVSRSDVGARRQQFPTRNLTRSHCSLSREEKARRTAARGMSLPAT